MEDNRKIVYNASFMNYIHNPDTNLLFILNYEEYNNFTLKYEKDFPNLIIDYMPDTRFLTHTKKTYNDIENIEICLSSEKPLLNIFTKDEKELSKNLSLVIKNLSNIYKVNICITSDINEIEKEVVKSRLVICEDYDVHILVILYQKPFISISKDRRVKNLLKNIGIEKIGFLYSKNLKYLINEWTVYERMINDFILNSKRYISDKLKFYNISSID